ncbi:MAG: prolipoprotein diacylglyceryl transferase [Dehalococcoidia bacterium]
MEIGIDPILFEIGSLEVRWYGVMVALAVLTGVGVPVLLARKEGIGNITQNNILSVAIWAVPGGIIGARLIHVFDRWSYFMDNPGEIVGGEGMGIFGAILGGTIVGVLYARIRGIPIGRLCDVAAFGLILAQAVGRIGCTLNGCCYGTPTDLPWGTMWTHPDSYGFNGTFAKGVSVHPTQIYELLFDLLIFAFLWSIRKRIRPPGALYLIYISTYSLGRFLISFLRTNEEAFLGLQQAQVVSLIVLVVAVGLIGYLYRKPPSEPDPSPSESSENTQV